MGNDTREGGLRLSWFKVVFLAVSMAGSVYATLVKADEKQQDAIEDVAVAVKKEIKQVAECKLDRTTFDRYTSSHQRANERMLDRFEKEFIQVKAQVTESEKKIIKLLTIQEERRNHSGS